MFTITTDNLKQLWKQNNFLLPDDKMIFFALRGCLPVDDANYEFTSEHTVNMEQIDHIHPRCTIGLLTPYGNYSWTSLILIGRDWLLLTLMVAFIFASQPWKTQHNNSAGRSD